MRPNRHTIGLLGVLLAMWYAGASQNNAAAYLIGFLTLSVAAVSAVHGWSNLRGLRLAAEPITPVFEEEPVAICIQALAEPGRHHVGVRLQVEGARTFHPLDDVSSEAAARLEILAPAQPPGRYRELTVVASSTFPLGFFTARRVFQLAQEHFVYPKPEGDLPLPTELRNQRSAQVGMAGEGDDFAGVREWQRGQSMRHVDWKAVARGQRLMVKQWSGSTRDPLTFSWKELAHLAAPERLRQLARWLVQAERLDLPYGLELPGAAIPISRGDAHFHRCLRALAELPESA